MQTYKIIDIMGDFSLLIDIELEASNINEAKELVMKLVKENIDKYVWPVMEEIKGE